mmetsp:Transcript_3144/g.9018  ORF Transcript_3144/g.9018 Transcript_3144/m.9018 type:complete len:230 (+) Transcript_3144:1820-2509(+)
MLGPQRIAQEEAEGAEPQAFISFLEGHEILPIHRIGLGRGRAAGLPPGLQHVEPADPPEEPELPPPRLQLQLEAREDADDEGAEEVALRQRVPPHARDLETYQISCGFCGPVPLGERGRVSIGGRSPVHICPCRPADGHVPLQVPPHAPGAHVQGPETFNLLPLQHGPGRQGPRLRLLGAGVAGVAVLSSRYCSFARTVARQFISEAVRGAAFEGHREDGDEAARRVAF